MFYYKYQGKKYSKLEYIKRKGKKLVSIILPTYNEKENIALLVKKIKENLRDINFEIIIVDDNSRDGTAELIDKISDKNVLAMHRIGKRGILSALIDGVKIASGTWIITMDSDLSHPPELINKFLEYKDKYDLISGSRFIKGGGMEAPFARKLGSIAINKICGFILGLKMKDVAGGFHLIKKEDFQKIKFNYKADFGEFDFELLYRAKKLGLKIKEIPFVYKFREKGKSKMADNFFGLFKNSLAYFKKSFQLRFEL